MHPPSPFPLLINLLMRKPFTRLQILLLQRRIQYPQPPYLARRGCVVAFYLCFCFAVGCLQGQGTCRLEVEARLVCVLEMRVVDCVVGCVWLGLGKTGGIEEDGC